MSNPQRENGHTDIANEIIEALARIRISGEAMQVLFVIIRKTYGWQKKEDRIPLSQFVNATGMGKVAVCKAIQKLNQMNLIITQKGNDIHTTYCFNKDYDSWKALPKKVTLPKKVIGSTKKGNKALPKKVHSKETTKETISKERNPITGNIFLTDEEKTKLIYFFGEEEFQVRIDSMESYAKQIGEAKFAKKYISHYDTLLNWYRRECREKGIKPKKIGKERAYIPSTERTGSARLI